MLSHFRQHYMYPYSRKKFYAKMWRLAQTTDPELWFSARCRRRCCVRNVTRRSRLTILHKSWNRLVAPPTWTSSAFRKWPDSGADLALRMGVFWPHFGVVPRPRKIGEIYRFWRPESRVVPGALFCAFPGSPRIGRK